jgi:hypothetical protein
MLNIPDSVQNWTNILEREGLSHSQAYKRAIQRAFEEGDITEMEADTLGKFSGFRKDSN